MGFCVFVSRSLVVLWVSPLILDRLNRPGDLDAVFFEFHWVLILILLSCLGARLPGPDEGGV